MSGQRDKFVDLQSLQNGSSSGGCIEPTSNRVIGDGDSVEDVLCFDRRSSLVNTALGLMAYQVPQVCDLMMRHWMDMLHLLLRHDSLTAPKLRRMLDSADSVLKELKDLFLPRPTCSGIDRGSTEGSGTYEEYVTKELIRQLDIRENYMPWQ